MLASSSPLDTLGEDLRPVTLRPPTLLSVGLDLAALIDVLTSDSSTVALVFVTLPVLLLGITLGAAFVPGFRHFRRQARI